MKDEIFEPKFSARLYKHLKRHPTALCWQIASDLQVSQRTVQRTVIKLVDAGLLKVEKDGKYNRYEILG